MKENTTFKRQHAIVIGGSIGGLLAARVLSQHFERVTLLERDQFPTEPGENRRGVPQGRHTHGLLASGANVFEHYFPGLGADLERCGALCFDLIRDGFWFHEGASTAQFDSGMRGTAVSRPLLEAKIRERVLALRNVECIQNTVIEKLYTFPSGEVRGVHFGRGILESDLVVDATGRGSHATHWLKDLGYPTPAQDRVGISLGYSTRVFKRTAGQMEGKLVAVVPPTPLGKRGGVALVQEGDRWAVTLVSHFQTSPPLDLAGFIAYAKSLPSSIIYDLVKDAEPLGDGIPARTPASIRNRYEGLRKFPPGFLVLGDAICSFNPIYGQGMSVSALEAVALDQQLALTVSGAADPQTLAQRFFREAGKIVDIPWSIAVGNDLRMPETVGERSVGVSFVNWYVSKLHRASHSDPVCCLAFHRVANLLDAPSRLMSPGIAWRVLKANLFSGRKSSTNTADLPVESHSASSPLDPSTPLSGPAQ